MARIKKYIGWLSIVTVACCTSSHAGNDMPAEGRWIVKPAMPTKSNSLPALKPSSQQRTIDPNLSFVSPSEGREFTFGEKVNVEINLEKQRQITSVTLYVDGSPVRSLFDPPFNWNSARDAKLRDLPIGEYNLRATVKPYRGLPQHVTTQFSIVHDEHKQVVLSQVGSQNYSPVVNTSLRPLHKMSSAPDFYVLNITSKP